MQVECFVIIEIEDSMYEISRCSSTDEENAIATFADKIQKVCDTELCIANGEVVSLHC